jgi:hypothetical protein
MSRHFELTKKSTADAVALLRLFLRPGMDDRARPAAEWLVIVSSKAQALFDYLAVSLRDVRDVEIIIERRGGERRRQSVLAADERRRGERRTLRGERFPLLGYQLIRRNGSTRG